MNGIAIAIRCNYCSKQRLPFQTHRCSTGQVICDDCVEWHIHALAVLSGGAPRGCQECGRTMEVLRDSTPDVEVRMYGVPKDGIYQLLCSGCAQPYVGKRADLYKGTEFGNALIL